MLVKYRAGGETIFGDVVVSVNSHVINFAISFVVTSLVTYTYDRERALLKYPSFLMVSS